MLIHPWDASLGTAEWQEWLGHTDRFGVLAVNNVDPGQAPVLVRDPMVMPWAASMVEA